MGDKKIKRDKNSCHEIILNQHGHSSGRYRSNNLDHSGVARLFPYSCAADRQQLGDKSFTTVV